MPDELTLARRKRRDAKLVDALQRGLSDLEETAMLAREEFNEVPVEFTESIASLKDLIALLTGRGVGMTHVTLMAIGPTKQEGYGWIKMEHLLPGGSKVTTTLGSMSLIDIHDPLFPELCTCK